MQPPSSHLFSARAEIEGHRAFGLDRQEIEQKMDELARVYHDTHDAEIPEEIWKLARRLLMRSVSYRESDLVYELKTHGSLIFPYSLAKR